MDSTLRTTQRSNDETEPFDELRYEQDGDVPLTLVQRLENWGSD